MLQPWQMDGSDYLASHSSSIAEHKEFFNKSCAAATFGVPLCIMCGAFLMSLAAVAVFVHEKTRKSIKCKERAQKRNIHTFAIISGEANKKKHLLAQGFYRWISIFPCCTSHVPHRIHIVFSTKANQSSDGKQILLLFHVFYTPIVICQNEFLRCTIQIWTVWHYFICNCVYIVSFPLFGSWRDWFVAMNDLLAAAMLWVRQNAYCFCGRHSISDDQSGERCGGQGWFVLNELI